jgi:hypothetical protein
VPVAELTEEPLEHPARLVVAAGAVEALPGSRRERRQVHPAFPDGPVEVRGGGRELALELPEILAPGVAVIGEGGHRRAQDRRRHEEGGRAPEDPAMLEGHVVFSVRRGPVVAKPRS